MRVGPGSKCRPWRRFAGSGGPSPPRRAVFGDRVGQWLRIPRSGFSTGAADAPTWRETARLTSQELPQRCTRHRRSDAEVWGVGLASREASNVHRKHIPGEAPPPPWLPSRAESASRVQQRATTSGPALNPSPTSGRTPRPGPNHASARPCWGWVHVQAHSERAPRHGRPLPLHCLPCALEPVQGRKRTSSATSARRRPGSLVLHVGRSPGPARGTDC